MELSAVPGMSVGKIKELHDQLGITSVDELKAAAQAGRLRELKGFGARTEQRLLKLIQSQETKPARRLHLHHAMSTGEQIVDYLKTLGGLREVSFAGSLRRCEETVGIIEIVACTKKPENLVKHFQRFPQIASSQINSTTNCMAQLGDGAVVSLTAVDPREFVATLLSRTGSNAHLEGLARYAATKGLSWSPSNGKIGKTSDRLPNSEEEIYRSLDMQYVPPELREDHGEIEAASTGKLPEDLVTLEQGRESPRAASSFVLAVLAVLAVPYVLYSKAIPFRRATFSTWWRLW